jgi:hypothetical protein
MSIKSEISSQKNIVDVTQAGRTKATYPNNLQTLYALGHCFQKESNCGAIPATIIWKHKKQNKPLVTTGGNGATLQRKWRK